MKEYTNKKIDNVCAFWLDTAIPEKYYPVKDVELMKYIIDNYIQYITFGENYESAKITDRELIL